MKFPIIDFASFILPVSKPEPKPMQKFKGTIIKRPALPPRHMWIGKGIRIKNKETK